MRRIKRYDCFYRCGQLASANYGDGKSEDFLWDGLALVKRVSERFINEPHVGNAPKKLCFEGKPRAQRSARRARKGLRGNPVVSSKGTSYFNDMLGTTVGAKTKGKYSTAALTAFGENHLTTEPPNHQTFYTGKPHVAGLGHAFLFRNYRASLGKWQTADPLGCPDGWSRLVYCNNGATSEVDYMGCSANSWAYYQGITAETNNNWEDFASRHHSESPVRGEKYEYLVDREVLVTSRDYGIREIDGHRYHVYQDYYYDVYATEVFGALDPLGKFRSLLVAAGIGTGVVGLVVLFANPLVGGTVTVAGIVIGIAGVWEPDWEYLGNVYRIHPETVISKFRKELIE